MAQKVVGYIKLQIPAGKATPAPPVGPALGQHGVNIMAFTKDFNERTKNDIGLIIPVVTQTDHSHSSPRLLRQQFSSRRLARSSQVPVFLTRLRSQLSQKSSFRRSLNRRCLT